MMTTVDGKTPLKPRLLSNDLPSSSPAFATPAHPIRPLTIVPKPAFAPPAAPPVLPILLPPATLRPIAFRTFTKKHNLTLTSTALQALATFIGKNCGVTWREEGLGELVVEEVAKSWKRADGRVIVDTDGDKLNAILKQLEGSMISGRITTNTKRGLNRQSSLLSGLIETQRSALARNDSQESFGISSLEVSQEQEVEDHEGLHDPRRWLKVIGAFEQPRLIYNPDRKHFEKSRLQASFFPRPAQKTELFRQRYSVVYQRLLRNESFQTPTSKMDNQQSWKVTPITNLLGRSGSGHLLLGLLTVAPAGTLAISDLTGSIHLDLDQATPIDDIETWLCPGMIVLVDGVYEESFTSAGSSLSNNGGIGGSIGGRFIAFSIGAPRCETRASSLGLAGTETGHIGGGFGWVDFLGLGSDKAVGTRMRKLEQRLLTNPSTSNADESQRNNVVMLGEVNLNNPKTLLALRKVFSVYDGSENDLPLAFILFGSFIHNAALSSPSSHADPANDTSSIAYKEAFDAFAALLSDYPKLLRHCSFVFVPGDNDPWPSSLSAGAACPLPRKGIPDMFTSRIKRTFAAANTNIDSSSTSTPGEAIWTTNPSRLTLFGPCHDIVLFRDDVSGRLRRNAIPLKKRNREDVEPTMHISEEARIPEETEDDQDITMSGALPPSDTQETEAMEIEQTSETQSQQLDPSPIDHSTQHARRLVKTLLDQSHLSPFPLSVRPLHWSYASSAMSLYPLPSTLVLCDADAEPFSLVYQSCCVLNPGALISANSSTLKSTARWIEYSAWHKRGTLRSTAI